MLRAEAVWKRRINRWNGGARSETRRTIGWCKVARSFRFLWIATAGIQLLVVSAAAQIRLGETSTSASGTVSSGYNATYSNMTGSTHGWTVGGSGTFSGSFHSPNFLSYNFSPYLNQSRANSNFQSTSNASGLNFSANIFAGSKFPGSVNYSKAYNSEGNYAVPGLADYVTHGNSDTFGINWNENLPDAPSFSAGFDMGTSQYSVYGANDTGDNSFHSLHLHSGYRWEGFNFGAFYATGDSHSLVPEVVTGTRAEVQSDNDAYGLNVSHALPLHGSASGSINRSDWKTNYADSNTNGSIDLINASAAVHPIDRLSVSVDASYSDNLTGQIIQSIIAAGGAATGFDTNQSSNSLDLMTVATYSPMKNVQTSGFVERRTQSFEGEGFGVTSYGGNANYTHGLLNGTFNSSVSVTVNSSDQHSEDTIGFATSESYSNVALGWHVNESFSYAQNVQTLLVTYMNSFYNYSGNARRSWGRFSLGFGGGGSRTALTQQAGTSNSSQTFNVSTAFGSLLTATGNYAKSDGQALETGTGLVGVPVPTPVLPSGLVSLFGGKSYSFGLSSNPAKKLTFAASYGKATFNTFSNGISSNNENSQFNSLMQYQVRKLNFVSGYSRLQQGFSTTGTQPEIISTYYMGLSRWFNFF